MEEYKKQLIGDIWSSSTTIEELDKHIKNISQYVINRNGEGKLHSRR